MISRKQVLRQIREAQKDMETWPQWMKDAARFEGSRTKSWPPDENDVEWK